MLFWGRTARGRDREGVTVACRACGVCCDLYGHTLRAAPADLARWQAQGREDLLARVGADGELWWDPESDTRLDHCPFFSWSGPDRGTCAVHATKPAICCAYPTALHRHRCVMGVWFGGDHVARDASRGEGTTTESA